jgi:hypothetical protein
MAARQAKIFLKKGIIYQLTRPCIDTLTIPAGRGWGGGMARKRKNQRVLMIYRGPLFLAVEFSFSVFLCFAGRAY